MLASVSRQYTRVVSKCASTAVSTPLRQMAIYSLGEHTPVLPKSNIDANGVKTDGYPGYFVAPSASVIGQVVLEKDTSVWYGAVIRGDNDLIHIGEGTNVQDAASTLFGYCFRQERFRYA